MRFRVRGGYMGIWVGAQGIEKNYHSEVWSRTLF